MSRCTSSARPGIATKRALFYCGTISAFDLKNGTPLGQLRTPNNQILLIDGLWGIVRQRGQGQPTDVLLFAAGPNDENDGLYGFLAPAAPQAGGGNGGGNGHGH